jgi:hypothetical protein
MSNETHQAIAREAAKEIFPIGSPETNQAQREAYNIILAAIERSHEPAALNMSPKGFVYDPANPDTIVPQPAQPQRSEPKPKFPWWKVNKLFREALRHDEHPPATDDRVKEQGSHAVGQEWTPERLIRYLDTKARNGSFKERMQLIADDINTAVAAEREIADIGRRWKENSSLEQWFPFTAKELHELKQQLLQAHAAIAAVKQYTENYSDNSESTVGVQVISDIDGLLSSVDISALDKHDRELKDRSERAEADCAEAMKQLREQDDFMVKVATKPLVDALKVLLGWMKYVRLPCGVYSVKPLERAEQQARDALAKVKEGKCSS